MGQLDLQQVQLGKETVWGTAVAGTAKMMDVMDIKVKAGVKTSVIKTRTGSIGSGHIATLQSIQPTATIKGIQTYEDLYWIEGIFGISGSAGGPVYTRSYANPTTAVVTPRMSSLIYGNTTDGVYQIKGAIPSKINFSIESNKEVEYSVDIFGKSGSAASLAALSDRSVNAVMGNDFALYVDTWAGSAGSTAIATTAFQAEIEIDTGRVPTPFLGALGPGGYSQPVWEGSLKLRCEFNSSAKAWFDAMLNNGSGALFQKQVQLKATSGTNIFQIDFAGTSEEMPEIWDEREGVCAFEVTLTGHYNSTLSAWAKIASSNSVAVLP